MSIQKCFKRSEIKYKLNIKDYNTLLIIMNKYMKMDDYKRHKISNIYFDTDDYKIIRNSIEKPIYKEKLRIRRYNESPAVFIELKKKYKGIVYKRRINATNVVNKKDIFSLSEHKQINNEINYFLSRYEEIDAKVYLSYEREAYYSLDDDNLRMTFDFNIMFRDNSVSFESSECDKRVLSEDYVLLEVKTLNGFPDWFLKFLSENGIIKTSFSKYGEAYKRYIYPKLIKERSLNGNI